LTACFLADSISAFDMLAQGRRTATRPRPLRHPFSPSFFLFFFFPFRHFTRLNRVAPHALAHCTCKHPPRHGKQFTPRSSFSSPSFFPFFPLPLSSFSGKPYLRDGVPSRHQKLANWFRPFPLFFFFSLPLFFCSRRRSSSPPPASEKVGQKRLKPSNLCHSFSSFFFFSFPSLLED